MKFIRYFFEYVFIKIFFFIFKIIGYEKSSNLGEKIGRFIGPISRDKTLIIRNLEKSNIGQNKIDREKIINQMWGNYGRIFAEYPFLKLFSNSELSSYIEIEGEDKDKINNLLREFAQSLPRKPWEYTMFQKLRNGWFSQGIFRAKSKWENYVK